MRILALLCLLTLCIPDTGFSQTRFNEETEHILQNRGLIYFSVEISGREQLKILTKLVSIDQVKGRMVYAYASRKELTALMDAGFSYTLIKDPGINPDALMKDNIDLSQPQVWNYYPTYTAYESLMAQFQANYPGLCNIDTITVLASGRKILVARISDNVNSKEDEPQFLYVSSIHGDETTGYISMLHLIDYLLTNYNVLPKVTNLVNNIEIWICPDMNPDGTYYGGNSTVANAIRYNANFVDLNRNNPDPQDGPHPDGNAWQPENIAMMSFAAANNFTMAANFHGGSEVVNYPWDTWATLAADDAWWQFVSHEYADTVHANAPASYMDGFDNGISNGYDWYEIDGGRQDYMNYFRQCREVTIEISNTKNPPASQLLNYWNYNYKSFLNYMEQCLYGVRGIVTDSLTGAALRAKVFINGHDIDSSHVYSALPVGNYHRFLAPGTYSLTFSAPGYYPKTITGITVNNYATSVAHVQLRPLVSTYSLSGILTYAGNYPLANFVIKLKQNGIILDSVLSGLNGSYVIDNLPDGTYQIEVSTSLNGGGYNSTDALTVLKHFVGMTTLTGLYRKAADVDLSGQINSIDALLIQKRFVSLINSFPAGDWMHDLPPSVTLNSQNISLPIQVICTGDVNASWTP